MRSHFDRATLHSEERAVCAVLLCCLHGHMQTLLSHLMHHLLDEVRTDRSIGMNLNLFEARPFVNRLRSYVRFVVSHGSKVMTRMQVQMIMVNCIVGMLGAHMAVHHNGSRVDWDLVAIMIMGSMHLMVDRMNFVSVNDRVHQRFHWLVWSMSIFLCIT